MSKILVIHPMDSTTDFLTGIHAKVIKHLKNLDIARLDFNDEDHLQCKKLILKYKKIVFLGHGSHLGLHGAKSADYNFGIFFDKMNFSLFSNKDVLCLSCDSSAFFSKADESLKLIGFGNIRSEYSEIQAEREFDAKAYNNVKTEDVYNFQETINKIISNSIIDWELSQLTVKELYFRLRLRLNRELNDSYQKRAGHTELIHEMKNQMKLFY